jgi:hypothetical protein
MEKQKIVRRMEDIEAAVGGMNKAMDRTPEQKTDAQLELEAFKKKFPDAKRIEPAVRIPTSGIKHPHFEAQREYLTEYVVGVFESQIINGQLEFFLTGLPGDDYCKWVIPVNKTIGIPRFVAQHINKNLCWKEMKPLGRNQDPSAYEDENILTPFNNFETKRRGTFHPINAY